MRILQLKHVRLSAAVVLLSTATAFAFATVSPAGAQQRLRPTTTTTTTTTTTRPPVTTTTVVPTSVPTPSSISVISNVPDNFQIKVSPATQLGDAELLSGQTVGGPAIITVGDNGTLAFLRLVENSDYTIRYRNKIWIASTSSFLTSPWVQFNFHTPTFDSLRPTSPTNVRVVASTASTLTVRWDAVPTAVRYDYSLNGGTPIQTGICSGAYCTTTDPLTATFARPVPGTTLGFSVTATRTPELGCGAYCFPDNRFITSLPTTLTINS